MKKSILIIGLLVLINGCQKKECDINDPNCKSKTACIKNEKCECKCEKCCCCVTTFR